MTSPSVVPAGGKGSYPALSPAAGPGQHAYASQRAGLNLLLYLPAGYGTDPRRQWPLILFLHGSGEKGSNLEALKVQPLPETLEQSADLPFLVASPQLPRRLKDWADAIDALDTLLAEVEGSVRVDSRRIYLTGLSMGGRGTWQLALRHPRRFAALVPVAGYYLEEGGTAPAHLCGLREVPVWAFHGSRDGIVAPQGAERLVQAFRACGANIRFTLYPDAGHEATWRQAYADPELYPWLLSHSLR